MRIIMLVFGLLLIGSAQVGLPTEALAQVGSSISTDGSPPNDNAMLDVKSPTSGAGKGILIPRVSQAQRTTLDGNLPGGLLDSAGNLRGGAAQGLMVYQTDGVPGLYVNTNASATPVWVYLGEETDPRWSSVSNAIVADIATRLASNVWASAGSTTNYLPRTGGTMSGTLNMGAQIVSNVAYIDFNGNDVSVGRGANGSDSGVAVGNTANGYQSGAAVGILANGSFSGAALGGSANGAGNGAAVGVLANGTNYGAAMGYQADGSSLGVAVGRQANGAVTGVAVGASANGYDNGAAVGNSANSYGYGAAMGELAVGTNYGAAMGYLANGSTYGAAMGFRANGSWRGTAVGGDANGYNYGATVGYEANGSTYAAAIGYQANSFPRGAAVGRSAIGSDYGAAVGWSANGSTYGAAMGLQANGTNYGVALGWNANGSDYGVVMGYWANGARTNVAIGLRANARGGTNHIAIGTYVTNNLGNDTAVIRGTLYLDGGSGIYTNTGFGSSSWTLKTFEIDHPLDPENKILRHYCLEGPQVWNVYAGNAQLQNGQAVIELPDYYSALNLVGSEICSLTPWGRANVWVAQGIDSNTFSIAGDADVKVSWTIKVLRNDPGCIEDLKRRPVEQWKNEIGN